MAQQSAAETANMAGNSAFKGGESATAGTDRVNTSKRRVTIGGTTTMSTLAVSSTLRTRLSYEEGK
jgi:hypothetical protein